MNKSILLFLAFLTCSPQKSFSNNLTEKISIDALNALTAFYICKDGSFKPKGDDINLLSLIIYDASIKEVFPKFIAEGIAQVTKLFAKSADLESLKKYSENHFKLWSAGFNLYSTSNKLLKNKKFITENSSFTLPILAMALVKAICFNVKFEVFNNETFIKIIAKSIVDKIIGKENAENKTLRKTLISTLSYIASEYGIESLFMMACAYIYQQHSENNFDQTKSIDSYVEDINKAEKISELTSKATKSIVGLLVDGYNILL